jgi:hypothetical protein
MEAEAPAASKSELKDYNEELQVVQLLLLKINNASYHQHLAYPEF